MGSLVSAYNEFFQDGNREKLNEAIKSFGGRPIEFKSERMDKDYKNAVLLVSAFFSQFGFEGVLQAPQFKGQRIYDIIKSSPSIFRLAMNTTVINNVASDMIAKGDLPKFFFGMPNDSFTGAFSLKMKEGPGIVGEIVRDALTTFLVGAPIRLDNINDIKVRYAFTESIMQAVMFVGIGTEWLNNLLIDLDYYGMTVMDWCIQFDNKWFDVSHQIDDGFVTVFDPRKENASLVCVSTIYMGEYFVVSKDVFKTLYEGDNLSNIRFIDAVVPVRKFSNKEVVKMSIKVPIVSDGDSDYLVSDLVSYNFIYHEAYPMNISVSA